MLDFAQLGERIVQLVGGPENVSSLGHCVTRLRFTLKDMDKPKTEELKEVPGVINVLVSAGQYQVIIGNTVGDVFQEIEKVHNFNKNVATEDKGNEKGTLFEKFVRILAGVFTPLIGVLSATGIIMGTSILFVALGWMAVDSGTFVMLQAIGGSLLLFSPIFVGYTAAKSFGMNPFTGMAIGSTLINPNIMALMDGTAILTIFSGTPFESAAYTTFMSIPVLLMDYTGSIIPVIFAAYVGSKVEVVAKKYVPNVLKLFVVPAVVLLVTVPITFLLVGPLAIWLGQGMAYLTMQLYNFSGVLAGVLTGALWQVFVFFGIHHALMPISLNNMDVIGFDSVLSSRLVSIFAVFGVTLAVMRKASRMKKQKVKDVTLPASISAFFGVTEPAIYGVLIPYKNAFLSAIIAGSIGGGVSGFFGARLYNQGGLGILAFPSYLTPDGSGIGRGFWGILIGSAVACLLGFILYTIIGKLENNKPKLEKR